MELTMKIGLTKSKVKPSETETFLARVSDCWLGTWLGCD
jgi:hypothetical protein